MKELRAPTGQSPQTIEVARARVDNWCRLEAVAALAADALPPGSDLRHAISAVLEQLGWTERS